MTQPPDDAALVARLRKRLAEATETPWHLMASGFGKSSDPTIYAADDDLRYIARFRDGPCFISPTPDAANAALVHDAVNALPGLLDALEAKDRRIAELEAAQRNWMAELADMLPDEIDLFRTIRDAKARRYADAAKAAHSLIVPLEATLRSRAALEPSDKGVGR